MAIDFEQAVRVAVDILTEFQPVNVRAVQEQEGAYLLEKKPGELLNMATNRPFYDGAARAAVAGALERGDALPDGVLRWAARDMRREIMPPKAKPGRVIDEALASHIGLAVLALTVNGTVPTRAESSEQRSGCDAVAQALDRIHRNPPPNFDEEAIQQISRAAKTYDSVKHIWHDFQKRSGLAGTE